MRRAERWGWAAAFVMILTAPIVGCGGARVGSAPSGEEQHRADWQENKPATYSFTLDSQCGYMSLIGRFAVRVHDGDVARAEGLDESARVMIEQGFVDDVPTLDELLDELDRARLSDADRAEAEFDPTDGHPTLVEIDHDANATDDEACYHISDYRAGSHG